MGRVKGEQIRGEGQVRRVVALSLRDLLIVFVTGFASGRPPALSGATPSFRLAEAGVALAVIGWFAPAATPCNGNFMWVPFIHRVPCPG